MDLCQEGKGQVPQTTNPTVYLNNSPLTPLKINFRINKSGKFLKLWWFWIWKAHSYNSRFKNSIVLKLHFLKLHFCNKFTKYNFVSATKSKAWGIHQKVKEKRNRKAFRSSHAQYKDKANGIQSFYGLDVCESQSLWICSWHHFPLLKCHGKKVHYLTWFWKTEWILHSKPGVWLITKAVHVYIPQKPNAEMVISQKKRIIFQRFNFFNSHWKL